MTRVCGGLLSAIRLGSAGASISMLMWGITQQTLVIPRVCGRLIHYLVRIKRATVHPQTVRSDQYCLPVVLHARGPTRRYVQRVALTQRRWPAPGCLRLAATPSRRLHNNFVHRLFFRLEETPFGGHLEGFGAGVGCRVSEGRVGDRRRGANSQRSVLTVRRSTQ